MPWANVGPSFLLVFGFGQMTLALVLGRAGKVRRDEFPLTYWTPTLLVWGGDGSGRLLDVRGAPRTPARLSLILFRLSVPLLLMPRFRAMLPRSQQKNSAR
jgi:hypothetical protein